MINASRAASTDWLPETIHGAPVYFGGWRTFYFGADLRLEPASAVWAPEEVSTKGMKEENVETLMLLNLDVLFPNSHLALGNKSLRDWSGADIEATDPAGCRHLFEVKYGAPASHVVDQALSYALDTVRAISAPTPYFHEQPDEDRERFIACRVAGFWTDTRADKWKRETSLAPAERDWKAMERILTERPVGEITPTGCRQAAARFLRLPAPEHIPTMPTQVQFHLVVPTPSKIAAGQLFALGRLKWRGHRARVWQVAAEKASDGTGGRLTIREIWIPPTDTARSSWSTSPKNQPLNTSIVDLLACAAQLDPTALARMPTPLFARGECADFGDAWSGDVPRLLVAVAHDHVKFEAWVINPKSLVAVHGAEEAQRIQQQRCTVISEWLLQVAPPNNPDHVSHIRTLKRRPLSWECTDPETGVSLSGHHSSGLKTAKILIHSTDTVQVARILNRSLHHLHDIAARHQDAFGPDIVTL